VKRISALGSVLVGFALSGCATTGAAVGPPVHELPGEIRGLASADPDGDGVDSLFALEAGGLFEVQLAEGRWQLEPRDTVVRRRDWHGLTAGDLDRDGHDELVLWSLRNQPWGLVLLNGGTSAQVRRTPVVLRIVVRDGEALLLGQEPGVEADFRGPLRSYRLGADGVEESGVVERRPPRDVLHVFHGPALDADDDVTYSWDEDGLLERREGAGVIWRGETVQTSRPLVVERERQNLLGEQRTEVQEIPTEPLLADLDGDGVDEVLTVASDRAPLGSLGRLRAFRGGCYRLLAAEGRGLAERARSVLLGRFATAVALYDVDGDGQREAVMSVVLRRRSGVSAGRSALVVLDPLTGDLLPHGRPVEAGE
jgi:hypothetical protein